jgi:hypothetical protein
VKAANDWIINKSVGVSQLLYRRQICWFSTGLPRFGCWFTGAGAWESFSLVPKQLGNEGGKQSARALASGFGIKIHKNLRRGGTVIFPAGNGLSDERETDPDAGNGVCDDGGTNPNAGKGAPVGVERIPGAGNAVAGGGRQAKGVGNGIPVGGGSIPGAGRTAAFRQDEARGWHRGCFFLHEPSPKPPHPDNTMADIIWHYLENQFDNATKDSRKRMNIIVSDFAAKLALRAGEHATLTTIHTAFAPQAAAWTSIYSAWRNKKAEYRGATQTFTNLLVALTESGPGAARSKIDEWDSKLKAHWSQGEALYTTLLPQGREPFTSGGRDNIVAEVGSFGERLANAQTPLGVEQSALQDQIDSITNGGGTPPQSLVDALAEVVERAQTVNALQTKVAAFHGTLVQARTAQQGREGQVDALSAQVEAKRVAIATEMYGHLGTLMAHFKTNPVSVGAFFDLDTLMATGPDEEPEPEPPTPPTP